MMPLYALELLVQGLQSFIQDATPSFDGMDASAALCGITLIGATTFMQQQDDQELNSLWSDLRDKQKLALEIATGNNRFLLWFSYWRALS